MQVQAAVVSLRQGTAGCVQGQMQVQAAGVSLWQSQGQAAARGGPGAGSSRAKQWVRAGSPGAGKCRHNRHVPLMVQVALHLNKHMGRDRHQVSVACGGAWQISMKVQFPQCAEYC